MVSSIYIHIPFCKTICSYCDFCKFFYNKKIVNDYLIALKKEIKSKYKNEVIKTLYVGGGSPSSFDIEELRTLFKILDGIKLSEEYEFSVEMNVLDITEEKLVFLKEHRVNRISIGIETVNEKHMKFLERYNNKSDVIKNVNLSKKYFKNINLDLMYAFPNQTIDELNQDIDFVLNLNPTHISIYSLIIEEHTKIYINGVKAIDEELESKMYYNIIKKLEDNGYLQYEISNFSKVNFESRHNLVYWNNEHYYGFGLGASGYIDDVRYTNTRNMTKYLSGSFLGTSEVITKNIDMENELMLGLRKINGINKNKFKDKYSLAIDDTFDIINLVDKKLIIDNGKNIFIPKDKLYVSNSILVNFIGGSSNE